MKDKLLEVLQKDIIDIFSNLYNIDLEEVFFEVPNDIKNGHLSTNVALKNSKLVSKNPLLIAEEISKEINNEFVKKSEAVKPGFINFYYKEEYFSNFINKAIDKDYFLFENKKENINVEYVSANPTGELHLGHARGGVYGDSLANLLKKVGYNVTKEYYINDAGVQMNNLGLSVKAFYLELCGEELDFPENGYKGKEIKEIASILYSESKNKYQKSELSFFIDYAYKYNLKEIKKVMEMLNIEFDIYSSEKSYHESGAVEDALKVLEKNGEIFEEDGAKWVKTTKYGDDKDRVLQKSDGTHTYLTSDVAYHKDKMDRTDGLLIDVWGGDHHGYVNRVKAVMQSLGYEKEKLEVLLIQMVSILENNEKVKMSKRAGTSVTIKDLLNIIEPETLRYFFIMRSPDTQLDFDIALAQKENSENPIFYIQYAHARICSLIEKSNLNIKDIKVSKEKLTEADISIINNMIKYKDVVEEAANVRKPHLISNYLYELASSYHSYYNLEKIIVEDEKLKSNKILISNIVKIIISDGLMILGIKAKNKM